MLLGLARSVASPIAPIFVLAQNQATSPKHGKAATAARPSHQAGTSCASRSSNAIRSARNATTPSQRRSTIRATRTTIAPRCSPASALTATGRSAQGRGLRHGTKAEAEAKMQGMVDRFWSWLAAKRPSLFNWIYSWLPESLRPKLDCEPMPKHSRVESITAALEAQGLEWHARREVDQGRARFEIHPQGSDQLLDCEDLAGREPTDALAELAGRECFPAAVGSRTANCSTSTTPIAQGALLAVCVSASPPR